MECTLHKDARKGKHLRKSEKQILQQRRGVLQKHVKIDMFSSEMFRKIAALKFPGKYAWWKPLVSRCIVCTLEPY